LTQGSVNDAVRRMESGSATYLTFAGIFAMLPVTVVGLAYGGAPPPWLLGLAVIWTILFALLNLDARRAKDIVRGTDAFGLYARAVDGILGVLARMMAPGVSKSDPSSGPLGKVIFYTNFFVPSAAMRGSLRRRPFSWPVADAALRLAIVYPLLALLIQWAWTGDATGVAGVPILPAGVDGWWRAALVCPLVLYVLARMLASATRRPRIRKVAGWIFFVSVSVAVAGAVAFAVAFAVAGAGAVAVAVAGADAFALAGALAGTFAGAVVGAALVGRAAYRGRGMPAYAVLVICVVSGTLAILVVGPRVGLPEEFRLLIFALCLLPALNAVFDYLSYGFTLLLLTRGRHAQSGFSARIVGFALLDLAVAGALLVGLGLTLTCAVAFVNAASGVPLFDLAQAFEDLRDPDARGAYTWLILSCLTTLVPTLVHFSIAALSAAAWMPAAWKGRIADAIESEGTGDIGTLLGTAAAAAAGVVCLVVMIGGPLWAFSFLLSAVEGVSGPVPLLFGVEEVGLGVLRVVEWLARLLGALPPVEVGATV
jgi:hypothetical protein